MDFATDISPIVFDIETAALPDAADFLDPVVPDARLKDPAKIEADIAEKEATRIGKLGLDWNVGRIVAIGWWTERELLSTRVCRTEDDERATLAAFWSASQHRTLVGYNVKGFDLKYMVQRSRYLDIPYPVLDLGKYTKRGIVDLFSELTFSDGTYDQGAMRRTLHAFCRRFRIPVTDETTGKDIAAMVAAEDWEGVEAHVASDVRITVALAQRLRIVRSEMSEAAGF